MRAIARKLVVVATLVLPLGAAAKSSFTEACRVVCENPELEDIGLPTDPRTLATLTQLQIEQRKIYDTTRYGRSNDGHWWTNGTTLSDPEVEALIKYLKTL